MSKRRPRPMAPAETAVARPGAITATSAAPARVEAFTFGDPEPVLDRRSLLDVLQCWRVGNWWEMPVPAAGLARAFLASPHHNSAIILKRNLLVSAFEPTPFLSRATLAKLAQDYLVFGNAYPERVLNRLGGLLRIEAPLARFTRRGVVDGEFWFVPGIALETPFAPGSVMQLAQPDVNQELYGVPEYLAALQSALLNESATLFRRRYYLNGSHAGYILYATGEFAEGDVGAMREALKKSKGPGNFRNLFVHAPAGKENGIKLLPIAEVGAKDEFLGIKNTTRDDVLAAHRVPPQLLGIVPANAGGFGDAATARAVFLELEIEPLMAVFEQINDWLGVEAVRWRPRASAAALAV